jgi:hypothetical protein
LGEFGRQKVHNIADVFETDDFSATKPDGEFFFDGGNQHNMGHGIPSGNVFRRCFPVDVLGRLAKNTGKDGLKFRQNFVTHWIVLALELEVNKGLHIVFTDENKQEKHHGISKTADGHPPFFGKGNLGFLNITQAVQEEDASTVKKNIESNISNAGPTAAENLLKINAGIRTGTRSKKRTTQGEKSKHPAKTKDVTECGNR